MTPQEAIDYLNMDKNIRETCEADDSGSMLFCEALKVAISVLEKQIPKKVKNKVYENYVNLGKCPCCGNLVNDMINSTICNNGRCGQTLDWG